jgi:hypothetical protein
MPEMLAYCGKRLIVSQRADKIFDMIGGTGSRRMREAVFLDDIRCNGSAHGGCQQGCRIIWKTTWLRRVGPRTTAPESLHEAQSTARTHLLSFTQRHDLENKQGPIYRCQATELLTASHPMHPWDPRAELRALSSGNVRFRDFVLVIAGRAFNFAQRLRGGAQFPGYIRSARGRTPHERLDLQPGEWVQVKSLTEIASTLDREGKNRGMRFDNDMVRYCGGHYRVLCRVERVINERTGVMLHLRNPCIILEGVEATGEFLRFNPQREYPYWREIWLRRIPNS